MPTSRVLFNLGAIFLCVTLLTESGEVRADDTWEICDWCQNDLDYRSFAVSKGHTREAGTYTYYIGNPFTEVLRQATVSVEDEVIRKLVFAFIQDAPSYYVEDFKEVSRIATLEGVVLVPPGICFSCGSYLDSLGEPDFLAFLYNSYASNIIADLTGRNNFIVYLVKSYFGIHASVIVVFPNGDSVKVDIKSITNTPNSLQVDEETAVDANGNPIQHQNGDTSHHVTISDGGESGNGSGSGLGGLGSYYIAAGTSYFREQWYLCGPDGNGGYGCVPIPKPEDVE